METTLLWYFANIHFPDNKFLDICMRNISGLPYFHKTFGQTFPHKANFKSTNRKKKDGFDTRVIALKFPGLVLINPYESIDKILRG